MTGMDLTSFHGAYPRLEPDRNTTVFDISEVSANMNEGTDQLTANKFRLLS